MNTNTYGETDAGKQSDTELLQTSAQEKENNENSSIVQKIEQYEDTPFHIGTTTDGCFISIGNNRVSHLMTYEECVAKIEGKDWGLIVSMYYVLINTKL